MVFDWQIFYNKLRQFAIIFFVVSLPFGIYILNNIAIFILAACWLFESSLATKWQRIKHNRLFLVFIQLFLVYIAGLAYSENHSQGFFEIEKKLSVLLFPLVFATLNPISSEDMKQLFKWFIIFTSLASLVCLSYAVYLNYKEGYTLSFLYDALVFNKRYPGKYNFFNFWYFTYKLLVSPIHMHPVYFAMYLVFSSCLAVWLWWDMSGVKKNRNVLVVLLLMFNFISVVLLASRTQLFILLLLATFFIIYQAYVRKRLIRGVLFILLVYSLGLVFILLNPFTRERFIDSNKVGVHFSNNKYGEGGLSLRMHKWKYTLETIRENVLFGTGTGDSQDRLQETYKKHDFKIGYNLRFNAHNQFLQVALELGVIGLISFLICLFVPLYYAFKEARWLYVVFLIIFLISCLTESMLEVNKGIVFYTFFNSLFAFHLLHTEKS